MDILEIFRQAIKGGGDRLGQQFSPFSEEERQANMNQQPNFPGYNTLAGADAGPGVDPTFAQRQYPGREGIAAQFAPQGARPNEFPGVDDMRQHRGTGYTVPDAVRQDIMGGHDAGRDYGYEGPGQYPQDVVDRVLMEEQARRKYRTMPGSPVDY
tara:strand:+ start:1899 stop:2363 length:465 start_codon:yes stop_codon:yes gene_type:complete